ncbi:hypothetical protein NX059_007910 [Plenodomus lindquistii]|nr:hypothetical protein NX059_007910 [Plenodomus lindquistii]
MAPPPTKERIPSHHTHPSHPSPITPTYALALQTIYRKKTYDHFYSETPHSRTSIDPCLCESKTLRYRAPSTPRPWRGEGECNMDTYSSDARGVLADVKLEPHGMEERPMPDEGLFPETWVIDRCEFDEDLYPQYGQFYSRKRHAAMTKRRVAEQKKARFLVGFQPFLMRVFVESTVTKSELPAPWCDMRERTFWEWFVRNMRAIGVGKRFCWVKLLEMKRREQVEKWRADGEGELSPQEENMLLHVLPLEGLEQLLSPVEESKAEEDGAMALKIREHLKCIEEARREKRRATRQFAARQQEGAGGEAVQSQSDVWFLQKCKDVWGMLWT